MSTPLHEREPTDEEIRRAVEFLRGQPKREYSQAPWFAYCEKHQTVHSSLEMEEGCFEGFLSLLSDKDIQEHGK